MCASVLANIPIRRLVLLHTAFRHLKPQLQHVLRLGIDTVLIKVCDHCRNILFPEAIDLDAALLQPAFEL